MFQEEAGELECVRKGEMTDKDYEIRDCAETCENRDNWSLRS